MTQSPSAILRPAFVLVLAMMAATARSQTEEWTRIGFPEGGVTAIAVDRFFSATIYASVGTQLYRTIDAGRSWEPIASGTAFGGPVRKIASTSTSLYVDKSGFVSRSDDGGDEWVLQTAGSEGRNISALAASAEAAWFVTGVGFPEVIACVELRLNPCSALYLGTPRGNATQRVGYIRANPTSLAAVPEESGGGILAGFPGQVWSRYRGYETVPGIVTQIAAASRVRAYAIAWEAGAAKVHCRGPAGWVEAGPGLPATIRELAVHPSAPDRVYAATSDGVYVSPDGGRSWDRLGLAGLDVGSLALDPNDAATLYAGTSDGLYVRRSGPAAECLESATVACLDGGRFRVEASWRASDGRRGRASVRRITPDTASFWFFHPDNLELAVKVLDGTLVNGHHWVFGGSLTTLQYEVRVADTRTGASRQYVNRPGQLRSFADVAAFSEPGSPPPLPETGSADEPAVSTAYIGAVAACSANPSALCLGREGRFQVRVAWQARDGRHGDGRAVPLTSDTGCFWFFREANVELVVKVLDGRAVNGRFWVFSGALSNVAYTITVTDTETGVVRTYDNAQGNLASFADTEAF